MKFLYGLAAGAATLVASAHAVAATVTFDDILLGSATTVMSGGVTLATTSPDGAVSTIGSGPFAGLYIGVFDAAGVYTLAFSEAIDSIEIEFDALTSTGGMPPETISGFATNNGPIAISYVNQVGTTFDGSTITSTAKDGQGIISFMGAAFTQFIFSHAQNPEQFGFVIERIVINTTADGPVIPVPPAIALFFSGLIALTASRRRIGR